MRFTEIDLFGVYVAPMSLMMVAAWLVTIALRRVAEPLRLAALRLASVSVRVCRLHDRALVDDADRRALSSPWPTLETKSKSDTTGR